MPKNKIVKVTWIDSTSIHNTTWGEIKEAVEDGIKFTESPCVSVGFILKETKKYLVIAGHLGEEVFDYETQCSGDMTIPKAAIIKREELHARHRPKRKRVRRA